MRVELITIHCSYGLKVSKASHVTYISQLQTHNIVYILYCISYYMYSSGRCLWSPSSYGCENQTMCFTWIHWYPCWGHAYQKRVALRECSFLLDYLLSFSWCLRLCLYGAVRTWSSCFQKSRVSRITLFSLKTFEFVYESLAAGRF